MKRLLSSIKRWFLIGLLLSIFVAFFYFHLYRYLTLNTIRTYQVTIEQWTATHYLSVVVLYLLLYTVLIACTIPCATLFTLIGGFLFGSIAILYATLATLLGGVLLFFAVRTAIGPHIQSRSTGWIKKLEHGFQKNAFNYLLMLRLVPVFPCWVSNIAAGALNVPFKTFLSATVIGIFPSTLIYALAGRSLDKLLAVDPTRELNIIFLPSIFFPLLGLSLLSLFPIIYKRVKNKG